MKIDFNGACLKDFEYLTKRLETTPIIMSPNWSLPFGIICDESGVSLGVVLGQRQKKILHAIYYASKELSSTPKNYTVIEQKLLAMVFAFENFWSYLIGTKVVVYTDHEALRYFMMKKMQILD